METVKFLKSHPDAKLPLMAYKGDVGFDLICVEDAAIEAHAWGLVPIGLKIQLPPNIYATIETKSSFGVKGIQVHNGIIDSGFVGDCSPILYNHKKTNLLIQKGAKIAQMVFHRRLDILIEETFNPVETDRNDRGFGSSGA